jgi:hypothetical protein
MSLFRKILVLSSSDEEKEKENSSFLPDTNNMSIDEQFIYNFKKNGGKFLYCENLEEVKEHFENILENDWYESNVCYEPKLFNILDEKNSPMKVNPSFFPIENLIAEEGSSCFVNKTRQT